MTRLRIFYRCTKCGRIGEGDGYDLRKMWGTPAICESCRPTAP